MNIFLTPGLPAYRRTPVLPIFRLLGTLYRYRPDPLPDVRGGWGGGISLHPLRARPPMQGMVIYTYEHGGFIIL